MPENFAPVFLGSEAVSSALLQMMDWGANTSILLQNYVLLIRGVQCHTLFSFPFFHTHNNALLTTSVVPTMQKVAANSALVLKLPHKEKCGHGGHFYANGKKIVAKILP